MKETSNNIFQLNGGVCSGIPQIQNCPNGNIGSCAAVYYPEADVVIFVKDKDVISVKVEELKELINFIKK